MSRMRTVCTGRCRCRVMSSTPDDALRSGDCDILNKTIPPPAFLPWTESRIWYLRNLKMWFAQDDGENGEWLLRPDALSLPQTLINSCGIRRNHLPRGHCACLTSRILICRTEPWSPGRQRQFPRSRTRERLVRARSTCWRTLLLVAPYLDSPHQTRKKHELRISMPPSSRARQTTSPLTPLDRHEHSEGGDGVQQRPDAMGNA